MENTSKVIARISAGIFACLFVATMVFSFVVYNFEKSIFDAELYIQAFEKEDLYQRLPDLIAQTLHVASQEADANNPLALLRNLSDDEWILFVSEILPPKEIEIIANDIVRQIMAYLNGASDEIVISLASLKKHLSSPQGINAIYGILDAQPDCTIDQVVAIAMGQQNVSLCRPPDTFLLFDLRPIIDSEIKTAVSLVPEQVDLAPAGAERAGELQDLQNMRIVMRLTPLLPVLCLLMVTVIAVRSFGELLNWWGYQLFLAGLFSIGVTVLSGPLSAWLFHSFVAPALPENLPPDIFAMFEDVVASIAYGAVQPTIKIAGIMALLGLLMIATPFLLRKQRVTI